MLDIEFTPRPGVETEMWSFMIRHRQFEYADMLSATNASEWQIQNFASKLRAKGIRKPCGRCGAKQLFTVMDAKAAQAFSAQKRGTKEGAMWSAMRTLKRFTIADVMLVIAHPRMDITQDDVQRYCKLLVKIKYLAKTETGQGAQKVIAYRMVKDSGPLPVVQRTLQVVVDNNLEKPVYANGLRL